MMANNRIVHFVFPPTSRRRVTRFYSELFGWKFQKASLTGLEYWLCETGSDGSGINGDVTQRQHPQHSWMNYVDVANLDIAIEKAITLGAKVAMPRTPVPGVGAFAAIIDPQGNIFGLWEQASK